MSEGYSMKELTEKFGVTQRTVYYYIQIGLLPPANRRGRNNRFPEEFAQKLSEILQYRQKVKLSAIPYLKLNNSETLTKPSVLTLYFESSNFDFLKYAHEAISLRIKKLALQQSALQIETANKSMIVAFPVTNIALNEIKTTIDAIEDASLTYNGGVQFKTKLFENNFVPMVGVADNE